MLTYSDPVLLVFLILTVIGWLRLRPPQKRTMLAVGIAGLLLLSWPPADWLFSRPLEVWYPVRPYPAGFAEAIVVLSSSIDPPTYSRPYSRPDETTFHRCLFAAWLYRNWKPLPVLACGGRGATREPYSISMQRMLLKEGIPASMIWTEEFSHNTRENALFGARILRQHGIQRIALVVEAQSMLRAGACFRKLGMEVTPAASGFRGLGPLRDELMPSWTAVHRNAITTHEIGGLIWYWLRGWI